VSQQRLSAPLAAVEALPDAGTDAIGLARLTLASAWTSSRPAQGSLPENWLLEAVPASELTRLVRSAAPSRGCPVRPRGWTELRGHIAARLVQNGIAAGHRQHHDHLRRLAGI
jgi:hypothetical protein